MKELVSFVLVPNAKICGQADLRILGELTAKHVNTDMLETTILVALNCQNRQEISAILALIFAHAIEGNKHGNFSDLTAFCGYCCRQISLHEDDPLPEYVTTYLQKNNLILDDVSEIIYISTTVEMWKKFKTDLFSQWKKLKKMITEELEILRSEEMIYQGLGGQMPS